MNDYFYKDISDMYHDDINFLSDKVLKELLDTYLTYSHDDFFEDEQIVEKKIPEFNFVK
jgi:hypothetical protein